MFTTLSLSLSLSLFPLSHSLSISPFQCWTRAILAALARGGARRSSGKASGPMPSTVVTMRTHSFLFTYNSEPAPDMFFLYPTHPPIHTHTHSQIYIPILPFFIFCPPNNSSMTIRFSLVAWLSCPSSFIVKCSFHSFHSDI